MGQLEGSRAGANPNARWFFGALGVGVFFALPSLWAGFVADDYVFIARLEHTRPAPTWQLYEFASGEAGQRAALMHSRWAAFPWWMAETFKLRFLRPLSSGLFALDHALFGHNPIGYHVHSLLWYALLLLAVGLLLKTLCSARTWRVALPLFAVCAGHAEPAAWLASRHMLVSTVPALFGLVALIRYREAGFRAGFGLGILGILLGLAGGEAALSVACYWLAYEALAERGAATRRRLGRVAAPVLLIVGYAALYKALGYGTAGSAAYLDPISSPATYLQALPGRLLILLAELLGSLPSGLASTSFPGVAMMVGAALTAATAVVLGWRWPEVGPEDRRALGVLLPGSFLALLVNAGAFLGPRLALIPGIGVFVAVAVVLNGGFARGRGRSGRVFLSRALVAVFALLHAVVAPLGLSLNCLMLGRLGEATNDLDAALGAHFAQRRAIARRPPQVFVLAASDPFAGFYAASLRDMREPGSTGQWTILSMSKGRHQVERTGASQLTLRADPRLLRSSFEGLFRAKDSAFSAGDELSVANGVVRVLSVEGGLPTSFSLELRRGTFDDPDVCLLAWRDGRLVPIRLALRQELELVWSPGPTGVL